MFATILAAVVAFAPLSPASPSPTPDPSDTPCYRGSLYCPPPLYGLGNAPCQYVLGHWVTPFGVNCSSGSSWHTSLRDEPACVDDPPHVCEPGNPEGKPAACYDARGVIVELWPCGPVPDGVYAPVPGGAW
jgi:hypothetical protein